MSNHATWTEQQLKDHNRKMREGRGDPVYESEAEFQADAEKLLKQCGFNARTPANIAKCHGGLWYIHLHKTKANPIIADLILLDSNTWRYVELELKNGGSALSIEQTLLHKRGEITLCRNKTEFEKAVFKFMEATK